MALIVVLLALPWSPVSAQTQDSPVVTVAAGATPIGEGKSATFTLTRTGDTSEALTVNVSVNDPGGFLRGNNWEHAPTLPSEATFKTGSSTHAIALQTRDDWRDISDGGVTVTVLSEEGYEVGASASATVTVTDDDVAPEVAISVDPAEMDEGETATFTVRRIGDTGNPVRLRMQHGVSGSVKSDLWVSIEAEETEWSFEIPTADDSVDAPDWVYEAEIIPFPDEAEYWSVLGPRKASVTVQDNDLPRVSIEAVRPSVREGERASFRIVRVGDDTATLRVAVDITDTPGVLFESDSYTEWRGFGVGQNEITLSYFPQAGDGDEPDGTLTATLRPFEPATYLLDSSGSAVIEILDADPSPILAVESVTVPEDAGAAEFVVSFEGGTLSLRTVTVDYATGDGTAAAGADYTGASGTLVFEPGARSKTVSVPIIDDLLPEQSETFTLTLTNPSNAGLSEGEVSISVTGAIEDDEPIVTISARGPPVTPGETVVTEGGDGGLRHLPHRRYG